jgi:hypothetical protein
MFEVDIACAGILPENTSQVLIWSWSDVFLTVITLELGKDLKNHNFLSLSQLQICNVQFMNSFRDLHFA